MRRIARWSLAAVLAMALTLPAAAHGKGGHGKGGHGGNINLFGVVTALAVDDDPSTDDSLTLMVLKANGPGRRFLESHPGDPVVGLTERTRFRGPHRLGAAASDYRVGDGVRIKATVADDALEGRRVGLLLQAYHGTVSAFDGASVSLDWTEANKVAQAWLAANGDPATVVAAITSETKVEGDPQPGSEAEMQARPTADGTGLEAVALEASAAP